MAKKTTLTIEHILSKPTNIVNDVHPDLVGKIYDYCWNRFQELRTMRSMKNEKLAEANKQALQVPEKKDFPWTGAASVKYPLITNACIDYAARIFPAVWQDGDVAKTLFYKDHKDYAAGDRIAKYLNWMLQEKIPAWQRNLDKLCTAYPINGTMLKKIYFDPEIMSVRTELVFPQDFFVPNEATSLSDAECYFHRTTKGYRDIIGSIVSGVWGNVQKSEVSPYSSETGNVSESNVRPEEKNSTSQGGVYEIVEGYVFADLDGDGYSEPYIVTFLPALSKIVRIVPRFTEDMITRNEKGEIYKIANQEFFVPYDFIESPDSSIYGIGLGELLLPINQAVNTTINQLLDAGTLNNTNGGWYSNNVRLPKGADFFTPGKWQGVNSFSGKLQESFVPHPRTEPSQTTYQLMNTLIDAGAKIAGAQDIRDIQIPSNLSAISSMAIIENGMTGLKAVYKRFHRSLSAELRLILYWVATYGDINEYIGFHGGNAEVANDFSLIGSIVPVSDPNLITTISKATKAQQLMDMANQGIADSGLASMQILDLVGIDPSSVTKKEMSPMEKIALQKAGEELNAIRAGIIKDLALALRAKDQGIGDLARANSETMARAAKGMNDISNAARKKVVGTGPDGKPFSVEMTDTGMLAEEIAALAKATGISFTTPIGSLLGEKLKQGIEEGVKGVNGKTPDNQVRAAYAEQLEGAGIGIGGE